MCVSECVSVRVCVCTRVLVCGAWRLAHSQGLHVHHPTVNHDFSNNHNHKFRKDYVGKVELGVLKWNSNWKWYRDDYARLYQCLEGDPIAARERALKRKRIILYDPPFPGLFLLGIICSEKLHD